MFGFRKNTETLLVCFNKCYLELLLNMYAIVDIETTGGIPTSNGITEIAVIVHDGVSAIHQFQTLINPLQPIPSFITGLTGISNAMVASAPTFQEIARELDMILSGNIFVAHNVNFDYSFIQHQMRRHGYELPASKLCTVRLSRKVFPGLDSYSLGKLCRSLAIEVEDRHRAYGDAKATTILFEKLLRNGAQPHIEKMLNSKSVK
jgi:DNA polymerase-3 subunit epsilon